MAERTLKKKYSRKEFQRRADEILGRLFREATAFEDTSEAAKSARRERGRTDHFEFFRTYLPHYFNRPEAPFHHDLVGVLDRRPDPALNEVVIPEVTAAPRDFAKTTITSFGYVLHQICYARRHFILLGSDTEDLASDLTGYLYLELLYNERLRGDFGELVRENWAVDDFVTLNDIRVKARGRGQRVRGLKHKQWRPDLIILDDLENDQNVRNPELVRKVLKWVLNTVYPAIEAGGNLFWVGTILAPNSALATAIHSPEEPWRHWHRRLYKALYEEPGPDGRPELVSLWPGRHPVAKLLEQKRLMGSLAFNQEKQNSPVNEEGAFREEWFQFFDRRDLNLRGLICATFVDPSTKSGETNDFKAILTVGLDRPQMIFYCLHAWIRRTSLAEMFAAAYQQADAYGGQVGIEDNMLNDFLHAAIEAYAQKAGRYLAWRPVTHSSNKEGRVVGTLSYLVEYGKLRFERGQSDQDKLREQLLYFPAKTVNDDGPDALEGAVKLLQNAGGPAEYESLGKVAFGRFEGAW